MRAVGLSVLVLGRLVFSDLPAQDPQGPPPAGQQQPQQQQPVLVDTVVATVNDAAIMLSTVRTQVAGKIEAAERRIGRRLKSAEIITLFRAQLDEEVDKHALAQSAKSFGFATPEQIEQLFADEMRREEAAQVRDLGTWQEFSRELQRQGRTWQTYMREQRVEKMSEFAKDFAIRMRMQKQSNLFLTPKMLRETYRREIDRFVHGSMAQVVAILFRGPDAEAHAAAARGIWADADLTPSDVIARIEGATATAVEPQLVTPDNRDSLASEELADFALAGPAGAVSGPMSIGAGILVAKVIAYRPAREGRFEDPDVQLELRSICLDSVINEFTKQALERAANRTEVWKSQVFR